MASKQTMKPRENGTSAACSSDFDSMKAMHDEAYLYIENGLKCDQDGHKAQASYLYDKGLLLIDRALTRDNSPQGKPLREKMRKTKTRIIERLQELRNEIIVNSASTSTELSPAVNANLPPPYEEVEGAVGGVLYPVLTEQQDVDIPPHLSDSILSDQIEVTSSTEESNASMLLIIPEDVQMFYVTKEGYVSAPSYPSSLKIYSFDQQQQEDSPGRPPAFLKIGNWVIPLVPGCSPVLHSTLGPYMFPDISSTQPGASVGVIIGDTVPAADRENFERLLGALTDLTEQTEEITAPVAAERVVPPRPPPPSHVEVKTPLPSEPTAKKPTTTEMISHGLVAGAELIAAGLVKGAEKGTELVVAGSQKLRERYIKPELTDRKVDPTLEKTAAMASSATAVGVRVSAFLVNELAKLAKSMGAQIGPHLRRQVVSRIPKSVKEGKDVDGTIDGVLTVAAGGIHGFATVYSGLEQAAIALASSIKNETVQIVHYKYGRQVGHTAGNALDAAGNVAMTTYNIRNLGVKAIAKNTGKETAKAAVKDFKKNKFDK